MRRSLLRTSHRPACTTPRPYQRLRRGRDRSSELWHDLNNANGVVDCAVDGVHGDGGGDEEDGKDGADGRADEVRDVACHGRREEPGLLLGERALGFGGVRGVFLVLFLAIYLVRLVNCLCDILRRRLRLRVLGHVLMFDHLNVEGIQPGPFLRHRR